MNRGKLSVSIRPVPGRADTLIALFSSPILASTFSVVFPDSVTGALALHDFAEMLRLRYGKPVELILDTDLFPMRSKAMEDVVAALKATTVTVPSE